MVSHRPHQSDRARGSGDPRVRLLLPGAFLVGWLIIPQPGLLACELPGAPKTDQHLVYVLDPHDSTIRFDADARLHTFTGVAGTLSGRVRLPSASLVSEAVGCVEIEARSLSTGIEMRDKKMRRSHLHTDRFPTILFTLSGVDRLEPRDDDRYTGTLRGTLTLHGVTAPLMVPAKATVTAHRLLVEGTIPLRLSTFQIPIPSFLFIPMKDEVVVSFKVVAVPE